MSILLRPAALLAFLLLVVSPAGCRKPDPAAASAAPPDRPAASAQPAAPAPARTASVDLSELETRLTETYRALEARRKALPPGDAGALESFNRDAIAYTKARAELIARKAEVARQEKFQAEADQPARDLLPRLRAAINIGDYKAQARMMTEALEKYRDRPSFGVISATVRPQLDRVTPTLIERWAAGAGAATGRAAPAESAASGGALGELRALINGPLQPVSAGGGPAITLDFHPNPALTPLNYASITKAELLAERKIYGNSTFVRPKRHPELVYRTEELEFNLKLKYYYADQTLPTKRLSDADYDRIVALCREIAKEAPSAPNPAPEAATALPAVRWMRANSGRCLCVCVASGRSKGGGRFRNILPLLSCHSSHGSKSATPASPSLLPAPSAKVKSGQSAANDGAEIVDAVALARRSWTDRLHPDCACLAESRQTNVGGSTVRPLPIAAATRLPGERQPDHDRRCQTCDRRYDVEADEMLSTPTVHAGTRLKTE